MTATAVPTAMRSACRLSGTDADAVTGRGDDDALEGASS